MSVSKIEVLERFIKTTHPAANYIIDYANDKTNLEFIDSVLSFESGWKPFAGLYLSYCADLTISNPKNLETNQKNLNLFKLFHKHLSNRELVEHVYNFKSQHCPPYLNLLAYKKCDLLLDIHFIIMEGLDFITSEEMESIFGIDGLSRSFYALLLHCNEQSVINLYQRLMTNLLEKQLLSPKFVTEQYTNVDYHGSTILTLTASLSNVESFNTSLTTLTALYHNQSISKATFQNILTQKTNTGDNILSILIRKLNVKNMNLFFEFLEKCVEYNIIDKDCVASMFNQLVTKDKNFLDNIFMRSNIEATYAVMRFCLSMTAKDVISLENFTQMFSKIHLMSLVAINDRFLFHIYRQISYILINVKQLSLAHYQGMLKSAEFMFEPKYGVKTNHIASDYKVECQRYLKPQIVRPIPIRAVPHVPVAIVPINAAAPFRFFYRPVHGVVLYGQHPPLPSIKK